MSTPSKRVLFVGDGSLFHMSVEVDVSTSYTVCEDNVSSARLVLGGESVEVVVVAQEFDSGSIRDLFMVARQSRPDVTCVLFVPRGADVDESLSSEADVVVVEQFDELSEVVVNTLQSMSSSDIYGEEETHSELVKRGMNEYYDTHTARLDMEPVMNEIAERCGLDMVYVSLYSDYGGVVLGVSDGGNEEWIPTHDKLMAFSTLSSGVSVYSDGDEDARFRHTDVVRGKNVSWAVGSPLVDSNGAQIGSVCGVVFSDSDGDWEWENADTLAFQSETSRVMELLEEYRL